VPYPADTEIIANVVTSPHHLGATMVTSRTHRMTELFGRLAPGATVEEARAELTALHAAMMRRHPEAYSAQADVQLSVTSLRDQLTAPARIVLLVLLAAAAVVFVIACSNVANLILARSVRREGELAVRAALGASRGALRRTLLAESVVLCGAGAAFGLALSQPFVKAVAGFAVRFSVRALEVRVDSTVLWVGAALAMAAAVLLAYVPRLPAAGRGLGLASHSLRITPGTNRRLAIDLPTLAVGVQDEVEMDLYLEMTRRIDQLPGVKGVALGNFVPWRDAGRMGPGFQFTAESWAPADGEEPPHARIRMVTSHFFSVLGVPLLAGFAGVALLIAVVGVAGVLAFSVSARTRELGVRLAIGSSPRRLLLGVLGEGASIVAVGIAAGAVGGYAFTGIASSFLGSVRVPGALPLLGAATLLVAAAVFASLMPAARAARVDVTSALRAE
jgi:hypothetical protein